VAEEEQRANDALDDITPDKPKPEKAVKGILGESDSEEEPVIQTKRKKGKKGPKPYKNVR
jgi:hypothetical protein